MAAPSVGDRRPASFDAGRAPGGLLMVTRWGPRQAAKRAGRRPGQADDSEGAARSGSPALKPTSAGERERRPSGDGGETPGGQHPRGLAEPEPERRREPEDGAGRASAAAAPAKAREEESERRREREPSKEVAGARGAEDRRGGRSAPFPLWPLPCRLYSLWAWYRQHSISRTHDPAPYTQLLGGWGCTHCVPVFHSADLAIKAILLRKCTDFDGM